MVFSRCETLVALLRFKRELLFVKSLTGMPVHSPYRQYIALGRQVGSTEQENRAILTICIPPSGSVWSMEPRDCRSKRTERLRNDEMFPILRSA